MFEMINNHLFIKVKTKKKHNDIKNKKIVSNTPLEQHALKIVSNSLNNNISSKLDIVIYLNAVHFFNASANYAAVAA